MTKGTARERQRLTDGLRVWKRDGMTVRFSPHPNDPSEFGKVIINRTINARVEERIEWDEYDAVQIYLALRKVVRAAQRCLRCGTHSNEPTCTDCLNKRARRSGC